MTLHALLLCAPLFVLLGCAAVFDLRSRRIPNWLTFTLVLAGLGQSFCASRTVGPLDSVLGLLAGFGVTFGLFALGALGGGDVKLLAGVGAWMGPLPVVYVFAVSGIVGMVIVVLQAVWQGRIQTLLRNSAVLAINLVHVREVGLEHASSTGRSCRSVDQPLPYAVPVLLAALVVAGRSWISA